MSNIGAVNQAPGAVNHSPAETTGSGAGFAMVFALLLAAILWLLRSFL